MGNVIVTSVTESTAYPKSAATRGCFTALLHLDPRDQDAPHALLHQQRGQTGTGEDVARVFVQDGLGPLRREKVHQLVVGAVTFKSRIIVGMQKIDDWQVMFTIELDQPADVFFKVSIVAALPAGSYLE